MNILARQVVDTMELRKIARHDGLTNLLSAVAFRRTAAIEVERARRFGRHVSFVVLDIDHFKKINDTHVMPPATMCCATLQRYSRLS